MPGYEYDYRKRRWVRSVNTKSIEHHQEVQEDVDLYEFVANNIVMADEWEVRLGNFHGSNLHGMYLTHLDEDGGFDGAIVTPCVYNEYGEIEEYPSIEVVDKQAFAQDVIGFPDEIPPSGIKALEDRGLFDGGRWANFITEDDDGEFYEGTYLDVGGEDLIGVCIEHTYGWDVDEFKEATRYISDECADKAWDMNADAQNRINKAISEGKDVGLSRKGNSWAVTDCDVFNGVAFPGVNGKIVGDGVVIGSTEDGGVTLISLGDTLKDYQARMMFTNG